MKPTIDECILFLDEFFPADMERINYSGRIRFETIQYLKELKHFREKELREDEPKKN